MSPGDLGTAIGSLRYGDPQKEETELGPLTSARRRERVAGFVDRAVATRHVEVVTGGGAATGNGLKLSGYGKDMSIYGLEDYTVVRHVMVNFG